MIEELIRLLKLEQSKLAFESMKYPDADKYQYRTGQWQGLQDALDIVDQVLKGDEEDTD